MSCSGSPVGFGVVAVHVCLPSSRDGAAAAPGCPALLTRLRIPLWAGEAGAGREPGGWGRTMGFWGFFWRLFLPVDKYQPAEVLKADVELVASADLPPVCSMDIVCGRRGQAASAPRCRHPHRPPRPQAAPLEAGTEQPVCSRLVQKGKRRGASVVAQREKKLQTSLKCIAPTSGRGDSAWEGLNPSSAHGGVGFKGFPS